MKKNKFPLVCIIILNWNGEKIISTCLESLRKTDYPNYKLLVADNGSTDKGLDVISKFKEVELIDIKENKGLAGGFNHTWNYCLKKYNPKYICNLNNDLFFIQKNWLSLIIKELEKEDSLGICLSHETFPHQYKDKNFKKLKKDFEKELESGDHVIDIPLIDGIPSMGGACMVVKTNVIKKIGGEDENFFFGPDDKDYILRAKAAGFKVIYTNLSRYVHFGSFSYKASDRDFIYKHQSYSEMLFSFRYSSINKKIKAVLIQLLRIVISRKDSSKENSFLNIHFHKRFPIRMIIFIESLFRSIKNYKEIKQENFLLKRN